MTSKKHLNKIVDQAVLASFDKGKLKAEIVNRLVKDFKAMDLTEAIFCLSEFVKGLKRELSRKTLTVESVVPVPPTQLKTIKGKLTKQFTISQINTTINPDILGGLRIQVGDTVLDYSVRSKLTQIKEAILG